LFEHILFGDLPLPSNHYMDKTNCGPLTSETC